MQATAACAHTTANTLHRRVLLESSTVSVGPDNTVYRDAYPKPELELPEKQLIFFIFLGIILVLFVSMHAFFAFMKCTNKEWKENQVVPEDGEGEGEGDEESASKSPRGADDSNSNASAPATPASSAAVPKPKSKLRGVKAWKAAAEARQQHPRFIWLQNAMVQVLEQTEKYEKERKVELKEQEAKYEKLKAAAKTASAVALFKKGKGAKKKQSLIDMVRPTDASGVGNEDAVVWNAERGTLTHTLTARKERIHGGTSKEMSELDVMRREFEDISRNEDKIAADAEERGEDPESALTKSVFEQELGGDDELPPITNAGLMPREQRIKQGKLSNFEIEMNDNLEVVEAPPEPEPEPEPEPKQQPVEASGAGDAAGAAAADGEAAAAGSGAPPADSAAGAVTEAVVGAAATKDDDAPPADVDYHLPVKFH